MTDIPDEEKTPLACAKSIYEALQSFVTHPSPADELADAILQEAKARYPGSATFQIEVVSTCWNMFPDSAKT